MQCALDEVDTPVPQPSKVRSFTLRCCSPRPRLACFPSFGSAHTTFASISHSLPRPSLSIVQEDWLRASLLSIASEGQYALDEVLVSRSSTTSDKTSAQEKVRGCARVAHLPWAG